MRGLKKNMNSSLPLGQEALKCCLPGAVFAWALAHRASEYEKLPAWQENLLVPDDRTGLFLRPAKIRISLEQYLASACNGLTRLITKIIARCIIFSLTTWTSQMAQI